MISCPTCGRTVFDVTGFLEKVQPTMQRIHKQLTVAIMGCPVNGPGEAAHADVGIAGSGGRAVLFVKGVVKRKVEPEEALDALMEEVHRLAVEMGVERGGRTDD